MTKLFKRYHDTSEQLILLSYQGRLSFDLVQHFIDQIESSMEKENFSLASKKKIYNVLVEVFQNLTHHIDHERTQSVFDDVKKASLKVWIEGKICTIATGNYIENTRVPKLESWLDKINSLNSEELRALYKEVLNNNTFSSKGGGGLGFLDIARTSGSKSEYKFEEVNNEFSYFNFETTINLDI